MASHELALEHHVRCGPLPSRLLACMRILTADAKELNAMQRKEVDPFQARAVPRLQSFSGVSCGYQVIRTAFCACLQVGSEEARMQRALLSCLLLVRTSYMQCSARCSPADGSLGMSEFGTAMTTYVHGQLAILDWSIEQCRRLAPS